MASLSWIEANRGSSRELPLRSVPGNTVAPAGGKYWKFAAQLNLYKHLLWDTCEVYAKQLLLVLLHPDGSRYDIFHVPEMMEIQAAYQKLKYRHCARACPTDGGP